MRIGVVAPGSRIEHALAERVKQAAEQLAGSKLELLFHPQCFQSAGHFAGEDGARAAAFLEMANDESIHAVWFARGGYGACRIAAAVLEGLRPAARKKAYLGYSDAGFLLAGLYRRGFAHVAHGPMPVDISRENGEAAVQRALLYLSRRDPDTIEPVVSQGRKSAAFNITVLSQLLGTSLEPDLSGHVLLLEEVGEYMYRLDRSFHHIVNNAGIRRVNGIMLGRCSAIPPNTPDFGQTEDQIVAYWCRVAGIPYLGRANIGHDTENRIVPFGALERHLTS